MKTKNFTNNQKMVYNALHGLDKIDKYNASTAIRERVKELTDSKYNPKGLIRGDFPEVFDLMEEILPVIMQADLSGKYDPFAEMVETAWGDEPVFTLPDSEIFPVQTMAKGNGDVERIKISSRKLRMHTQHHEISFYDEWRNFMANRIQLDELMRKASRSFGNFIGLSICDTIYNSYDNIATLHKKESTWIPELLDGILKNVKLSTGADKIDIWGESAALGKVRPGRGVSDKMLDVANNLGFYDIYNGHQMFELPQAYRPLSTDYATPEDFLLVLPSSEAKIIKVLFEGEPFIYANTQPTRKDRQFEINFGRDIGVSSIVAEEENSYGMFKFV